MQSNTGMLAHLFQVGSMKSSGATQTDTHKQTKQKKNDRATYANQERS